MLVNGMLVHCSCNLIMTISAMDPWPVAGTDNGTCAGDLLSNAMYEWQRLSTKSGILPPIAKQNRKQQEESRAEQTNHSLRLKQNRNRKP